MLARIALPVAALLWTCAPAQAGDKPLYAPAPGWALAAPAIDPAKLTDADPIFLRMDQQQRIENGQVVAYFDNAMRVASSQLAAQMGTIQLAWLPEHGDLTIHAIEILRAGERIDALAGGKRFTVLQREQSLERAFLTGQLTATLTVEGLRVGDVLRMSFSISQRDIALGGQIQTLAPLPGDPLRIGYGRVRMLWPAAMPFQWHSLVKEAPVVATEKDGWREINVALPLAKLPELPGDAPLRFQRVPVLEATSFADWRALSTAMAKHYGTAGTIAAGSPLAAEVERIRTAAADPRTRTALALQLVQDKIRYLFRGMENGNYIPQSPAQTWTVRYGDCKAKSLLLTAILRELGIEASRRW